MRLTVTAGCLVLVFAASATISLWKTRGAEALSARTPLVGDAIAGDAISPGPLLGNHDALTRRLSLLLGAAAR